MLNIKGNLEKRICDCEPQAKNEETYLEYIISSIKFLYGSEPTQEEIEDIKNKTNEDLNKLVDWLDYLWTK